MIRLIFKYIFELHDHTSNVCSDLELDLVNSECVGEWRSQVKKALKEHKVRLEELQKCMDFLSLLSKSNSQKS